MSATKTHFRSTFRYRRATKKGLPALQKLEAYGLLPATPEIISERPSRVRANYEYIILRTICRVAVEDGNLEILQWLLDGGYRLNKRILTKAAFYSNREIVTWLRENELVDEIFWAQLEDSKTSKKNWADL